MQHEREVTKGYEVASAARRMVESVRVTSYEHSMIIDPRTGTYFTDCSGFVSYVLEGVAPEHYGAIPHELAHQYPRASEFFDYFSSQAMRPALGWQRVHRFSDVREGDVVAWREKRVRKDEDSGHVFIVAEAPTFIDEGFWAVLAYDSSDIRHVDDSRARNGEFTGGVGSGGIVVHVDAREKPLGFMFSATDALHELPIAIGRLGPLVRERRTEN